MAMHPRREGYAGINQQVSIFTQTRFTEFYNRDQPEFLNCSTHFCYKKWIACSISSPSCKFFGEKPRPFRPDYLNHTGQALFAK